MKNDSAETGRPLRVLLLLGIGLGVWVMLRLPIMERDLADTRELLAPDLAKAPDQPLRLVGAADAGRDGGGDAVAVAQAEVAVAEAELALSRARLHLARVRRGEAFASALLPPAAPPRYAAVALPTRRAGSPAQLLPDYGYDLPTPRSGVRRAAVSTASATTLPKPVASVPGPSSPGHDLATAAYIRLQAGDRRGAAKLFDAALASPSDGTDEKQRAAWLVERRRLGKRWSGEIYSLFRDGGAVGPTASPVLGGGQTGINLGWTHDPLARRPVAVVARFNTATSSSGSPDNRTSQAAFGVRWQPLQGISVTAERLVRVGEFARNDWNLRIAGGADGRQGRVEWNGYGEAGVLGSGDVYGGAQARAGVPVFRLKQATLVAGGGAWGSIQTARFKDQSFAIGRFDMGPTLVMRAPLGRTRLELSADWRFRLAGGAFPGSGPAVTISTGF